ncbi:hypothetical protein D3C83_185230 [compost metagenome]
MNTTAKKKVNSRLLLDSRNSLDSPSRAVLAAAGNSSRAVCSRKSSASLREAPAPMLAVMVAERRRLK